MSRVLLFNIKAEKAAKIKMLCRKLYIETQTVNRDQYGLRMEQIIADEEARAQEPEQSFDEEMLYLADLQGGMLNILLDQLRRRGLSVSLKAVSTPTNLSFTPCELYREIAAEREAIRRGMTAHQTEE